MPLIPVNNVGQIGIVDPSDTPPQELPLNAWSSGRNVRMRDGKVEKFLGNQQAFGALSIPPYFAIPVSTGPGYFWVYASLAKAYAWDGSSHTNITRQTAGLDVDYAATALKNWTGDKLGPIPILNNQVDVPQMWFPVALAQKLQALSNWDPNWRCGAIRSFRRFLVAMDITKSGTRYKEMVKWSHPAPVGGVPASWDETDETKDAGEYEIKDTDGAVIDAARMRDFLIIYKDDSATAMQFVGGVDVFRFPPLFDSFGILSRRCAIEYSRGKHAVFAVGDIIAHDAQTWDSIISGRMRRWLFNQMDPTSYQMSYVTLAPPTEVWFCFPTTNSPYPNMAVVWDWKQGSVGVREISASHIAPGNVALVTSSDIWDNDPGVWDADPSAWGEGASHPSGKRLLMCDSVNSKLQLADSTSAFDGTPFTSYIERVSLPLPVKPDGPPDMRTEKFIREIYPRIQGTQGATIKVYFGKQNLPDGPITWLAPRDFIIGSTLKIDVRVSTTLPAIRFESTGDFDWSLAGYEIDASALGRSRIG